MSSETVVLVLGVDAQRGQYLKNILEFIDYRPLMMDRVLETAKLESLSIEAVLCGRFDSEQQRAEALLALKAWNGDIPVLQIVDKNRALPPDPDFSSDVFGYLELPTTYRQLTHLLHQASV